MPSAVVYVRSIPFCGDQARFVGTLKTAIARVLSCESVKLTDEHVTVRVVKMEDVGSLAPVEIDVTAHNYADRRTGGDKRCLEIRKDLKAQLAPEQDVRVWLHLTELGRSWDEA